MIDIRHHSSSTMTACLVSRDQVMVTEISIFAMGIEEEIIRTGKELLPFNDAFC